MGPNVIAKDLVYIVTMLVRIGIKFLYIDCIAYFRVLGVNTTCYAKSPNKVGIIRDNMEF